MVDSEYKRCDWLLLSDVDGTLTTVTSVWEYLHKCLGKWEVEGQTNLEAYLSGTIDYTEFARLDALAYKGLSRSRLVDLTAAIPRRRGMEKMLKWFAESGFVISLISSGLDILVDQIPHANIRVSNRLEFDDGICQGTVRIELPIDGKDAVVQKIIRDFGISREHVIALGDSRGDLPMFEAAGLSIAISPLHPDVATQADIVVDGDNLEDVGDAVTLYMEKIGI